MGSDRNVTANFAYSSDITAPVVTWFSMPSTSTSLTVPLGISASDNIAVTGYMITQDPIPPSAVSAAWKSTLPTSFTFIAPGNCYAYAWAKDAAGNVSFAAVAVVNISISSPTDTLAPLVTSFTLPSTNTLTVPVSALAVTDNVGVTGYLVSDNPAAPNLSDPRWRGNPPASFTFTTYGDKTLYAWAKDLAGNISDRVTATCLIMDPAQQLETVITGWPANPMQYSPSSFTFSSNRSEATFECSLDNGSYFACVSPLYFGALANGSHTFSVRSKDGIGNYDGTPANFTWTVNVPIVQVLLNSYRSVTEAYLAISDGDVLKVKGIEFLEDLVLDRPIAVTLKGGFDSSYFSSTGTSVIHGTLVVGSGTVTIDNIVIN
jgi:hypothetical protein